MSDWDCYNSCNGEGSCVAVTMYYHTNNLCRKFKDYCNQAYSENNVRTYCKPGRVCSI